MNWILIATIIVAVIVAAIFSVFLKRGVASNKLRYKKLDALFSPAERSFFGVLNQAVGEHTLIFGKVRVADVITPQKGMSRSEWQISFNKISAKHFDYLLCDKKDLSVLCVIELNDKSHNSKKRQERDAFLVSACESADLKLVQITAKATYRITEIQQLLSAYLPGGFEQSLMVKPSEAIEIPEIETVTTVIEKMCPKCSSDMIKKVAKKGKNIGNEFWACSAFPKCRHTEAGNV
jgi:hypothetical protein